MRRRGFITLLGAAAAWPLAARAQQREHVRRGGVLMGGPATDSVLQAYVAAFGHSLRQLGWTEGQNLGIDWCHRHQSYAGEHEQRVSLAL
jgi:putative tryptophan/tyrosine transport system substrate-binding protein